MGHRMHVVRAVTQRATAEYSWASWPENKENRRGIFFRVFLETGVEEIEMERNVCVG